MKDDEIDEFCDTSSWESGSEDGRDVKPSSKKKHGDSLSSQSDNSFRTDGTDDSNVSQDLWERNEEREYKNEKRNYREYLKRRI